jgi:hypothetical protein
VEDGEVISSSWGYGHALSGSASLAHGCTPPSLPPLLLPQHRGRGGPVLCRLHLHGVCKKGSGVGQTTLVFKLSLGFNASSPLALAFLPYLGDCDVP